jgi:hypothetical protein
MIDLASWLGALARLGCSSLIETAQNARGRPAKRDDEQA